jgi:HEAT repeat protein
VISVENEKKIRELLDSAQEEERLQGLKELGRCSSGDSAPAIIRALGDESWRVRKEAAELFISLPGGDALTGEIIELLHSEDNAGLRNTAVEILVRLGRLAIPLLLEELSCSDHDVRKFVLDILGEIGDESIVPSMLRALSDPDDNVRAAAAENLGRIGSVESVPALIAALGHSDLWFRFTVLEALGEIGAPVPMDSLLRYKDDRLLRKALFDCLGRVGDADALPVLIEGLSDQVRNVRESAAVALSRLGAKWPEAAPAHLARFCGTPTAEAVADMIDSADAAVRLSATELLGQIGDGRFAPRLLGALSDEDLRASAAKSLVALDREAVCGLTELWTDADSRTRTYLSYIFGEAGCFEALQLLLSALSSPDPELRLASTQSLGKLGEVAALAPLVDRLGDSCEEVREMAMDALSRVGMRHRRQAMTILHPLLKHEDPEWRMHAVSILGRLDGGDVEGTLTFAMKDESSLVRRAAVRAFEGKRGDGRLQALMLALTDEDDEVRRLVVEALGTTGDSQVVGALELALRDEDIWVRSAAVRALGGIPSEEAFRLVQGGLTDPVGLVAIAALETLSSMGAEKAHSSLVATLTHDDEEVVNAALQLLTAGGRSDWIPSVLDSLLNHRHWEVRLTFARALAELMGENCRGHLEERLLIEGEDLVCHQLRDLLSDFDRAAEVSR